MMVDAESSYHKYCELADELLDDSRAYHELLPKHKALEERCQKAESELSKAKDRIISAVRHIIDIAKLSNCMLAPITGYEDLAEKATPLHKALANVIRRLCSRFVKSLGFDKEAQLGRRVRERQHSGSNRGKQRRLSRGHRRSRGSERTGTERRQNGCWR